MELIFNGFFLTFEVRTSKPANNRIYYFDSLFLLKNSTYFHF